MGSLAELRSLLFQSGGDAEPPSAFKLQGTGWAVTGTRGVHFDDATVRALVATGTVAPVYPGTEAENQSYGRKDYFGSAWYVRQTAEKITRSKAKRGGA